MHAAKVVDTSQGFLHDGRVTFYFMTYSEKLRDPRWQKKRLEILERDNWRCVICSDSKSELQVHHLLYKKRDPWDYPNHLYQTLCRSCHELRQERTDRAVDALRIALGKTSNQQIAVTAKMLCAAAMLEIEVEP